MFPNLRYDPVVGHLVCSFDDQDVCFESIPLDAFFSPPFASPAPKIWMASASRMAAITSS
jgi:hypothetical protein